MARKSLFDNANTSLEPDDRDFQTQMADLSVPIERRPAGEIKNVTWFEAKRCGGRAWPIENHISVGSKQIAIGSHVLTNLGDGKKRIKFGVADYSGQKCLLVCPGEKGYKVAINKSGTRIVYNKYLAKKLLDAGLREGRYELKHVIKGVEGGWIATWVERE